MTKKKQGGLLLVLLLTIFAIRCILSVDFFRQDTNYMLYRSKILVLERSLPWAPAPSPKALLRHDDNSSLPLANSTTVPVPSSVPREKGVDGEDGEVGSSSLLLANTTILSASGAFSSKDGNSSSPIANNNVVLSAYPTPLPEINKPPKVEPIWRYLVSTLRRPSVPKAATKAMHEGLRAWKEINKTMTEEAHNRAKNRSHKRLDNKCPYFVSALNATELISEPFLLPIPCGLVLDSSVTIVGTPGSKTGTFALELIGSKLFDEGDEPIVFHLSVRLRGDQATDSPTIVQNTWTVAGDWQTEQRCPLLPDSKTKLEITVDGLKTCNTDIGQNVTRKAGPGLWKGLNERSTNTWFPFAEGYPFVTTISAGWDGYHVSVNGKHVTSFKYRQSLEPWMTNSLRIKGDLQTSSVIVNGLPVSDDGSLIPDLKVIRAPKLQKSATLFIGVFSSNSNFIRRMAIRRTWMQFPEVRNGTVVVRFFVGLHQNKQVNRELWTESLIYEDLQILPMVDYYNIITYKTLAICMYATYNLNTKYVMKTDDDTFVRVDAVLSTIFASTPNSSVLIPKFNSSFLLGNIAFTAAPERDPSSKWFVNTNDWQNETYPPWAHGPGYILTQDIAKFVVKGHQKNLLKFFKLEDVAMGIWIDQFRKQKHKKVEFISDENYQHGGCEHGYTISHYQNPSQMQCLWNNEVEGEHGVCCNNDN